MPISASVLVARLERDVPDAENRIDDALVAMSTLMASIVIARRDMAGVPPVQGHAAIHRLAKAQLALVGASGDVLRVHGDLAQIGKAMAGYDLHECPATARDAPTPLQAVA